MSDYIATAVCYFGLGAGLALLVSTWWQHSEHVQWMLIVDKYAAIVDRLLQEREHWRTVAGSLQDMLDERYRPIDEVSSDFKGECPYEEED